MSTIEQVLSWRGQELRGSDDHKLGTIEEIYLDTESNEPEWALITTGLFATKRSFVPLRDASRSGDGVSVPFDQQTVKGAPRIDPDGELSQHEEAELYRYYGLDYSERQSGSGLPDSDIADRARVDLDTDEPVGRDVSGASTDEAMTRSEEELRVGTRERERGRVRLRKYVVEDHVTETVPVRREQARLEREPITDANIDAATSGPEISSEEHEVVLHEEEPVVEKRVVPKERVRLDTDVEIDERQVSETVRRERIETDDDTLR